MTERRLLQEAEFYQLDNDDFWGPRVRRARRRIVARWLLVALGTAAAIAVAGYAAHSLIDSSFDLAGLQPARHDETPIAP